MVTLVFLGGLYGLTYSLYHPRGSLEKDQNIEILKSHTIIKNSTLEYGCNKDFKALKSPWCDDTGIIGVLYG